MRIYYCFSMSDLTSLGATGTIVPITEIQSKENGWQDENTNKNQTQLHLYWPFYGQFQSSQGDDVVKIQLSHHHHKVLFCFSHFRNCIEGLWIRQSRISYHRIQESFQQSFFSLKRKRHLSPSRTRHHHRWAPCFHHHSHYIMNGGSWVSISGANEVRERSSPQNILSLNWTERRNLKKL